MHRKFFTIKLFFTILFIITCYNVSYGREAVKYDLMVIGDAINNVYIECDDRAVCDKIMQEIGLSNGGFKLIDRIAKEKIEHATKNEAGIKVTKDAAVASATNTLRVVRALGNSAAFAGVVGVVGNDKEGRENYNQLVTLGITPFIKFADFDTPIVYIFTDKSGEKAMAGYFDRSKKFTKDIIPFKEIPATRLLMVEAYAWSGGPDMIKLIKESVIFAKTHDVKTAFTLGTLSVIRNNRADIQKMLKHFDVVFGTKDEFTELLNGGTAISIEMLRSMAAKLNNISAITMGKDGTLIVNGEKSYMINAEEVKFAVSTTGAGDAFAGGFLSGYINNLDLAECGKIGASMAAQIIQKLGTTL